MTRYYLDTRTDYVFTLDDDDDVQPERTTEVRIVPADAIVIERDELPAVRREGDRLHAGDELGEDYSTPIVGNPAWAWNYGLSALAVSLHLREHPPVDEAAVEALAERLERTPGEMADIARALIRDGVTVPAGWTKGGAA